MSFAFAESFIEAEKQLKVEEATLHLKRSATFDNRPLPNRWRVGQKVCYLTTSFWAWAKGDIGHILELRDEYKDKKAHEYQVFYTRPVNSKTGFFWTTPDDVELVEDV